MSTEETDLVGWSTFNKQEVGYNEIKALFNAVCEKSSGSKKPVVVDADELLANPRAVLSSYCEEIGVPFEEDRMLSWDPEDPVVQDKFKEWKGWHDHAIGSSGWSNNRKHKRVLNQKQQQMVDEVVEEVTPIYKELYENRIRVEL